MRKKYFWIFYFFSDFLSSATSWLLFNYYRKTYIENYPFEINHKLVISTLLISIFWILVYSAFGNYKNVYKKYNNLLTIIIPRHIHRTNKIKNLIQKIGCELQKVQ